MTSFFVRFLLVIVFSFLLRLMDSDYLPLVSSNSLCIWNLSVLFMISEKFFTLTWKFGCLLNIYIDNIQRVILSGAWLDIEINCNVNFEADLKKKDYWKSRSDITLPLGGNNDLECYEVVSMLLAEIVHRGNIMLNIEWQRNIACNF
jgi:hypothetical protein